MAKRRNVRSTNYFTKRAFEVARGSGPVERDEPERARREQMTRRERRALDRLAGRGRKADDQDPQ